jgi:choline dehydrogenase-like flavoprotein
VSQTIGDHYPHERDPDLWICDGTVFPAAGGVNQSLTIWAIACRTAGGTGQFAARGEF